MIFVDIADLLRWVPDQRRSRCQWLVSDSVLAHMMAGSCHQCQMIVMITDISIANAKRGAVEGSQGGRLSRLVLGRRGGALLLAVGGLPADRRARGRNRHGAGRAPPARGEPDRRRTDARGARRGHPRAAGGGRGIAGGDRGTARWAAARGLVPDGGGDADAARDRRLSRGLPARRADARRGRAGGDRPAPARGRAGPRAAVRVRGREPAAGGR